MSSSESNDEAFNAFLASLKPKKKEKYRLSSGSLDGFIVDDNHVSFTEDSPGNSPGSLRKKEESEIVNESVNSDECDLEDQEVSSSDSSSDESLDAELQGSGDASSPEYRKKRISNTRNEINGARKGGKIGEKSNHDLVKKKVQKSHRIFSNFTPKRSTASSSSEPSKGAFFPKLIFSSDSEDEIDAMPVMKEPEVEKDGRVTSPLPDESGQIKEDNVRMSPKPCDFGKSIENLCSTVDGLNLSSSTRTSSKLSTDKTTSPMLSGSPDIKPSTSKKKGSRILVLSSDESDNDILYLEDESDKENLERNIVESPNTSSNESPEFDDVFKTPRLIPKRPIISLSSDEDEEYTSLVSRVLGDKGAQEQEDSRKLTPKRLSEPKPGKSLASSTPMSRPPKICFAEKVKTSKSHSVTLKKDGIPLNLPPNCENGVGFKRNRELLTKKLYEYFNKTIFDRKLPEDMIVEWHKRLTKTAGVTKCSSRTITTTEDGIRSIKKNYIAKICLSEKVLDSLHRLRDTLCHEMCHAAVWLIDNQNDSHGPYWKAWACKAMIAHPDMPVVKRCHSYDIAYKFQYQCIQCRRIYGRHSKSIKVDKQVCGICKGRLVLLPHKKSDGTPAKVRQPNKFAMFVKDNYKSTQKAHSIGGMTPKHSDVMKALSEKFASMSTKK